MANEHVNKVIYGSDTLIDLTSDTATETDVMAGKTFHLASGALATGTATAGGDVRGQRLDGGGGGKVDYYLGTLNNDNPTLDIPVTLKKIDPVSGDETIVEMQESTLFGALSWHAVLDSDAWYYVFADRRQWENIESEISYYNVLGIDETPFQTISAFMFFPVPSEPRYIAHFTNWQQQIG